MSPSSTSTPSISPPLVTWRIAWSTSIRRVDKQIDKAIETIFSGQMSAAEAMRQAQESSIADLRRGGIKL
jgi:hypothetical protein